MEITSLICLCMCSNKRLSILMRAQSSAHLNQVNTILLQNSRERRWLAASPGAYTCSFRRSVVSEGNALLTTHIILPGVETSGSGQTLHNQRRLIKPGGKLLF